MAWGRRRAGLVLALLFVGGCSSGDGSPFDRLAPEVTSTTSPTTTAPPPRPLDLLWSTSGVQFASQPVQVGERLVTYVAVDGGMWLVAYNATTGAETWRRESTASYVTKGVGMPVVADEARAYHMAPRGTETAAIEAVDIATGEPAWITEASPGGFADVPELCPEAPDRVCATAYDGPDTGSLWSVDTTTGAVTRTDRFEGRELSEGLYDLRGDGDEQVAWVVDGQVTWQRPPGELFQGRDVTSDNGWRWHEHAGLLVGWLGTRQEWPTNGEVPFVPQFMAGVDPASGETRWVAEGDPICGGRLTGMGLQVDGAEPWIRCRMTGSDHVEEEVVARTVVTDAVMEGFDPATGATTWTVPLGAASALIDDTKPLVRLGPTAFTLVRDDGSRVAVDVAAGEVIEVLDDAVGWCIGTNKFDYVDGSDPPFRIGEDFAMPCGLDGTRRPSPMAADEELGAAGDGRFAWVDAEGLHVAREAP